MVEFECHELRTSTDDVDFDVELASMNGRGYERLLVKLLLH